VLISVPFSYANTSPLPYRQVRIYSLAIVVVDNYRHSTTLLARQALTYTQRLSITHSAPYLILNLRHQTITLKSQRMPHNTPDNLLKLAADLNKLGGELCAIGGKLATAATTLEQEAANVALANAQRWGVDVQVCIY